MRIGFNPYKDQPQEASEYIHQIIIPVFIPCHEGYFANSLQIFKLCLKSLFATIHSKTFITIVNNGSDAIVVDYLDSLFQDRKIHELIHTANIGKLNAILKGLAGNNIELVTIADSDVLFLSNWQQETDKIFKTIPRAGVVGIVPQYRTFMTRCENILWDKWYDKNLKFLPVKNPEALLLFYKSVGWEDCIPAYQKLGLGYETPNGLKVYLGSGHFVATYKKDMFDEMITYIGFKMGGLSEDYLDQCPLKKDYWRLTTYDNFAYHMGNVFEDWMDKITYSNDNEYVFSANFPTFKTINSIKYFFKTKVLRKIFKSKKVRMLFYTYKKLPKEMIAKY
jgi:hypothetical protein